MRETLARVLRSYGLSRGEASDGDDLSSFPPEASAHRTDCDFDPEAWDRGDRRSLAACGIGRVVLNRLPAWQPCVQSETAPDPVWRASIAVPLDADHATLDDLHSHGVRGARFCVGSASNGLDPILKLADRIASFGWHIELDLGWSGAYHAVSKAEWTLMQFPVAVSFTGLGGFKQGRRADDADVDFLLGMVQLGRYWLKLSADDLAPTQLPLWDEPPPLARALQAARKDRLIWGSGKQTTADSHRHLASGLAMLEKWVPHVSDRDAILIDNPARLYDFDSLRQ